MRRIVVLALAVVVAGCDGGRAEVRAPPAPEFVEVVAPDRAVAVSIPVRGATSLEEEVARDALARLGRARPITRLAFEHRIARGLPELDPRRRVVSIWVRHPRGSRTYDVPAFTAGWLAGRFAEDVDEALDRRGVTIDFFESFDTKVGSAFDPVSGRTPSADELRSLGGRIVARGESASLEVERVTGYPVASGAVRVAVRLTARQALAGTSNRWASTLLTPDERDRYSLMLVVLGPDGTPLTWGANVGQGDGGWWYGASTLAEDVSSPPLPDGPTRLDFEIDVVSKRLAYRLDCDGGTSRRIRDPNALCAALERKWIALLPPVASDATCPGGSFRTMSVEGTLAGVRFSREYSRCYAETTERWQKLLGALP
jgi:hypothetical protein